MLVEDILYAHEGIQYKKYIKVIECSLITQNKL